MNNYISILMNIHTSFLDINMYYMDIHTYNMQCLPHGYENLLQGYQCLHCILPVYRPLPPRSFYPVFPSPPACCQYHHWTPAPSQNYHCYHSYHSHAPQGHFLSSLLTPQARSVCRFHYHTPCQRPFLDS